MFLSWGLQEPKVDEFWGGLCWICFFEHFLVLGRAIPEGDTVYVLRKKKGSFNPNDEENPILLYDASTGKTYDASDPTAPLISIGSLISTENIYANIQNFDAPSLMAYNVDNTSDWRPFFTEKKYPKPDVLITQLHF